MRALLLSMLLALPVHAQVLEDGSAFTFFGYDNSAPNGTCLSISHDEAGKGCSSSPTQNLHDTAPPFWATGLVARGLSCRWTALPTGIDSGDTVVVSVYWRDFGGSNSTSTKNVTFDMNTVAVGQVESVDIAEAAPTADTSVSIRVEVGVDTGTAFGATGDIQCSLELKKQGT